MKNINDIFTSLLFVSNLLFIINLELYKRKSVVLHDYEKNSTILLETVFQVKIILGLLDMKASMTFIYLDT